MILVYFSEICSKSVKFAHKMLSEPQHPAYKDIPGLRSQTTSPPLPEIENATINEEATRVLTPAATPIADPRGWGRKDLVLEEDFRKVVGRVDTVSTCPFYPKLV